MGHGYKRVQRQLWFESLRYEETGRAARQRTGGLAGGHGGRRAGHGDGMGGGKARQKNFMELLTVSPC